MPDGREYWQPAATCDSSSSPACMNSYPNQAKRPTQKPIEKGNILREPGLCIYTGCAVRLSHLHPKERLYCWILRKGKRKGCAIIAVGVAEDLALALLVVADRAIFGVAIIKQRAQIELEQLVELATNDIACSRDDRF